MRSRIENGIEIKDNCRTVRFNEFVHGHELHYRNSLSVTIEPNGEILVGATRPAVSGDGPEQVFYRANVSLEQCLTLSRLFSGAAKEAFNAKLKGI